MLKMKIKDGNVKLKIDSDILAIDVVVGICRLYVALMENGFSKKDIDLYMIKILFRNQTYSNRTAV